MYVEWSNESGQESALDTETQSTYTHCIYGAQHYECTLVGEFELNIVSFALS